MKRIILFFILVCVLLHAAMAQEFAPSTQAQGYLNDKQTLVDHTTGILHHSLPLCTFVTGDFTLPVTLDYTAGGVPADATFGLAGYNWTLNTGGIVTRTLRGGIPDEVSTGYYMLEYYRLLDAAFELDRTKVNLHQQDGESDIFTATFNGQSVHFIIRRDSDAQLRVAPLEKTNVRIEPIDNGNISQGWIVVDEDGNRYTYEQAEWTRYGNSEGAISRNGIRNLEYISSWYLTKIEPYDGLTVFYEYHPEKTRAELFTAPQKMKIEYDSPIKEHSFDFYNYQYRYATAISNAIAAIKNDETGLINQINSLSSLVEQYGQYGVYLDDVKIELGKEKLEAIGMFMGMVAELAEVTSVSAALIDRLESMANKYSSDYPSSHAPAYLRSAAEYVKESLCDTRTISERILQVGTSYYVYSPLLESIRCGDRKWAFQYTQPMMQLSDMTELNLSGNKLSGIHLSLGSYGPETVHFLDKDSTAVFAMSYDYYDLDCPKVDFWGYSTRGQEGAFGYAPMSDYAKNRSLKSIRRQDGGYITLDYESNRMAEKCEYGWITNPYGGIRLKRLVWSDRFSERADTVDYEYPLGGQLVYDRYFVAESVHYRSGLIDKVRYNRVKYEGNLYVNTGNNGLYYPYVLEKRKGAGMQAYLFYVPSFSLDCYPFWLCGLPLGTAAYDENGDLKQLCLNRYAVAENMTGSHSDLLGMNCSSFFLQDSRMPAYAEELKQIGTYEFFVDAEDMESQYKNLPHSVYFNPYDAIYAPYIAPRTSVALPELTYCLHYGGKTLLVEKTEYRFESAGVGKHGCDDFFDIPLQYRPFSNAVYHYDNLPRSLRPTRTVTTTSEGTESVLEEMRVSEYVHLQDSVIQALVKRNRLTPLLKCRKLRNDVLQEETVYGTFVLHRWSMGGTGLYGRRETNGMGLLE